MSRDVRFKKLPLVDCLSGMPQLCNVMKVSMVNCSTTKGMIVLSVCVCSHALVHIPRVSLAVII